MQKTALWRRLLAKHPSAGRTWVIGRHKSAWQIFSIPKWEGWTRSILWYDGKEDWLGSAGPRIESLSARCRMMQMLHVEAVGKSPVLLRNRHQASWNQGRRQSWLLKRNTIWIKGLAEAYPSGSHRASRELETKVGEVDLPFFVYYIEMMLLKPKRVVNQRITPCWSSEWLLSKGVKFGIIQTWKDSNQCLPRSIFIKSCGSYWLKQCKRHLKLLLVLLKY